MSSCRDAALAYATQGWSVFPCKGKVPLTPHGFKDATTDPATLMTLFAQPCNLAIRTGQGLCVLDIDVRPSRDGHETLHQWEAQHAPLPRTRSVKTPSGGEHYYFTGPIPCPSKTKLGLGIDLKADGGYVLAPPSEGYVLDEDAPVAMMPDWLMAKLTGKKLTLNAQGQLPPGTQDDQLHTLACSLTRQGLTPEVIRAGLRTALLACPQDPTHPFTDADMERWMKGAEQFRPPASAWEPFNLPMQKKQVVCNANTALSVLEQHPLLCEVIWFDTFYGRIFTKWDTEPRPWRDDDTAKLLIFLQREVDLQKMARSSVEDALNVFVKTRTRHVVQDWIGSLQWDGLPRLETFLLQGFGAPDTPYIRATSKNFWLSLMARIYLPGCQSDHMLVLEGPQGEGKTSALRILGAPWYLSCAESVMNKDFFQALPGHLIVEIAELDSFRRAELTRIKQVISTSSDHYRPSYGRQSVTYHRQCVFVGTTNEDDYLRDMTGGRRFWPVPCGTINLPLLQAEREQLFAEAKTLFSKGCTWWEMPDDAKHEQEARREADVWETPITEFLLLREEVTLKEILCDALQVPLGQASGRESRRATSILKKLRWHRTLVRRGEAVFRVWKAPEREPGTELHSGDFAGEVVV